MTESPTDNDATAVHVLGALALELSGTAAPRRDRLAQAEAGELASLIAADRCTGNSMRWPRARPAAAAPASSRSARTTIACRATSRPRPT